MLVAGALLLALTYLLVQAAAPDAERHERTFDALRVLTFNEAALQRDVLKARAGLLRNYDPLVAAVENLRRAADTLRSDAQVPGSGMATKSRTESRAWPTAVADQEALVEAFKSRNALLQNSLSFLSHTDPAVRCGGQRPAERAVDRGGHAGKCDAPVHRAIPQAGTASDVTASLDRLAQWPIEERKSRRTCARRPTDA